VTPRLFLPDTNALSCFLRGMDPALAGRMSRHAADLRLSAVAWFELRYGADKRPDLPQLEQRLEYLRAMLPEVEPFEEEAAWHAAHLRAYLANLKPNAQPIGPYDVLLAGHALALGAIVITRNVAEFSRVPGLAVENWQAA